jgi:hypothetical protein
LVLVLLAHILLALSLLLPAVLLPLLLRRGGSGAAPGRLQRLLVDAQGRWAPVIGVGLVLTGIALVAALSLDIGQQPWLLVALAIYGVNLAIAMFIQRPRLRQLVGLGTATAGGTGSAATDADWSGAARRLRSMSYLMAVLIGAIGFLMMTKPHLW